MRTVVGQVRVATKPDPDNFEDALAAYIESDFEVHRLMVENSNLKRQLETLQAEKEKRAESNRENARKTRRKRS
jgi:regulator of replication initiation timing